MSVREVVDRKIEVEGENGWLYLRPTANGVHVSYALKPPADGRPESVGFFASHDLLEALEQAK